MYKRVNKKHFAEELKLSEEELQSVYEEEALKKAQSGVDNEEDDDGSVNTDESSEEEEESDEEGEVGVLKGQLRTTTWRQRNEITRACSSSYLCMFFA